MAKPPKKPLTIKQKDLLCRLCANAFIEIRQLCWEGEYEQAADLADVFHNVPYFTSSKQEIEFDVERLRRDSRRYEKKYNKTIFRPWGGKKFCKMSQLLWRKK